MLATQIDAKKAKRPKNLQKGDIHAERIARKLEKMIGLYPDVAERYSKCGWNPKERPLSENILREIRGNAPKSLSAAGLDRLKNSCPLEHVAWNLPPEIIDRHLGRDALLWFWANNAWGGERNATTEYLGKIGYDVELLEKFRVMLCEGGNDRPKLGIRAVVRLYGISKRMEECAASIDKAGILRKSASVGLKEKRIGDYSFSVLLPWKNYAAGWEKAYNEEPFRIFLDTPLAMGLMYKGKPNAAVSFFPNREWALAIHQMQGIRPVRYIEEGDDSASGVYRFSGGARGLAVLDLGKFAVELGKEVARFFGFGRIGIRSASNNRWVREKKKDGTPHIALDRAREIYDETAARLGFRQNKDKDWYLDLPKPA